MDIKETLEALDAVKVLAQDVKRVLADGKISVADFGVIFDLMGQFAVLNQGVQGVGQIPAEIKDLDAEEAQMIIAKALEIVAVVKGAA